MPAAATKTKICAACGEPFEAKRSDAKACSPRCNKRLQRHGVQNVQPVSIVSKIPHVSPADWELQLERQGKIRKVLDTLTRAGERVDTREFVACASDYFLDTVADFRRGPGWTFIRELVELAELVERESDEETKRCA